MDSKKRSLIIEMIIFVILLVLIAVCSYFYTYNKIGNDINKKGEEESMSVISIDSKNFDEEVLKGEGKVLVDFYADWCGPCKMMSPIIDEIANEEKSVKVCKLNVDNAQDIAANYNVMSIPTIMVFENGQMIQKFIGVTRKEQILNSLK